MEKPSPRLSLHTAEDLFEKLKWEARRLQESWSAFDSWNFIVTAHHLYYDWIVRGKAATRAQVERAEQLPAHAKLLFQAITDVSNGSKHFVLDHKGSRDRQVITEVTEQICAGYDSYFFGDMVHIRFRNYFLSMNELSALVMHYFDWIICGHAERTLEELSASLARMTVDDE